MADIRFRYAFPDPRLFDVAAVYLEISIAGDAPVADLLPPEMASLCFVLDGDWQHGPSPGATRSMPSADMLLGHSSAANWLRGRGSGFAIGLNPLAWPAILQSPAVAHVDRIVPLAALLGAAEAGTLMHAMRAAPDFAARTAVANAFLLERAARFADADQSARVARVRAAIADPDCTTVAALADRSGLTTRQLGRLTKSAFGFTPKLLLRRARFLRMLHRADAMSYDEWPNFIEAQYVDQSHLIRDFRFFLGMAPTHYFGLDRPMVRAAFASFRDLVGWTGD